jgi:hypothetical protein
MTHQVGSWMIRSLMSFSKSRRSILSIYGMFGVTPSILDELVVNKLVDEEFDVEDLVEDELEIEYLNMEELKFGFGEFVMWLYGEI